MKNRFLRLLNHTAMKEDGLLSKRIRDRIRWDKRISNADIVVEVNAGAVTLTGKVDSTFKWDAATEIVKQTRGVLGIQNKITIPSFYRRSDAELCAVIEKRIDMLISRASEYVTVEVTGGVVQLSGIVHQKRAKALASSIVWELSGVRDCNNQIRIIEAPVEIARVAPHSRPKLQMLTQDFIQMKAASSDVS